MRNATLIYNPVAGRHPARREKQIQEVLTVLRASSIAVKPAPTTGAGSATELARKAIQQGDDLVLVCGGDGTVNEVVNGIVPARVTLGILPGGTANIAAKELRLPHDPVRAARQLSNWSPRRVAVGLASWRPVEASSAGAGVPAAVTRERHSPQPPTRERSRYFLSVAGVGFDAYVIHRLSWRFKMAAGALAYIVEALRQSFRYSFPSIRCLVDGQEMKATFVVVHRTQRYAGWLHLAPRANLFEPKLTLLFFASPNRTRYFVYAVAVLTRQHLRLRDVEMVEGRALQCTAAEPGKDIYFELDGELVGRLPASFEVVPDALTLLVP